MWSSPCGRVKTVSLRAAASLKTSARSSEATSRALSGEASEGATTTGPCNRADAPLRSASNAPQSRSPSLAPHPESICSRSGAHAPAKRNSSRAGSHGAVSGPYASSRQALLLPKHRVLQGFGQTELHHALGRDLDRLARLRVAAHPRLSVGEH